MHRAENPEHVTSGWFALVAEEMAAFSGTHFYYELHCVDVEFVFYVNSKRVLKATHTRTESLNMFFFWSTEMGVMPEIAQAVEELDWL